MRFTMSNETPNDASPPSEEAERHGRRVIVMSAPSSPAGTSTKRTDISGTHFRASSSGTHDRIQDGREHPVAIPLALIRNTECNIDSIAWM